MDAATSPTDALWGEKSLAERFGSISGVELQRKVFEYYQADMLGLCKVNG